MIVVDAARHVTDQVGVLKLLYKRETPVILFVPPVVVAQVCPVMVVYVLVEVMSKIG